MGQCLLSSIYLVICFINSQNKWHNGLLKSSVQYCSVQHDVLSGILAFLLSSSLNSSVMFSALHVILFILCGLIWLLSYSSNLFSIVKSENLYWTHYKFLLLCCILSLHPLCFVLYPWINFLFLTVKQFRLISVASHNLFKILFFLLVFS